MRQAAAICIALLSLTGMAPAGPETELSFYGRSGRALGGDVTGNDPTAAGMFAFPGNWNASAAQGIRVTFWQSRVFGWGLEFSNSGAVARDEALLAGGLSELSLEDGLGLLSVNAYRRSAEPIAGLEPYVGAGLGLALPHLRFDGGGSVTDERQLTGATVQVMAGARYPIGSGLALFGEYQGSYSMNMADLAGGGSLDAGIVTNSFNFGISLGF